MSKIKYLIIVILFFSCSNNEKENLLSKSKVLREKNGLNSFDKKLKLDSTLNVKSDENDWKVIKYFAKSKEMKLGKNEKKIKFGTIDFYSNTNKNLYKIVYYNTNDGILKLVSEEDRFYQKLSDTVEIYLSHNYNYLEKKAIYSIDSLPTEYFVKKNQKKLKRMYEYAEKNNLEICGTAAKEILRKDFPESYTEINYSKFNKIKTELNR